jgi:translation initiation factor 1
MSRVVYQTGVGRTCPECGHAIDQCVCKTTETVSYTDGIVRISLDRKGRKGKGVSLITGLGLETSDLKPLAKKLKAKTATGGAIKDGVIEIQGDQRDILKRELEALGYTVKLSGG